MSIRKELVQAAINRAYRPIDNDVHKRYEFRRQTVLADESLTKDERSVAIKDLNEGYDANKILYNKGKKKNL